VTWLVLIVSLPPHPSSRRVRVWRRLRAVGAVALKNSVYLLPFTPENHEHFQWLAQEVQRDGGEATLLKVDRIENLTPADVIRLFREARDADYRQLGARYAKLEKALERKPRARSAARLEAELTRLGRELARIREIDFFDAPAARDVERLKEAIERRRGAAEPGRPQPLAPSLDGYRGRRWVTRPRPHVDRLASAWLIKRFIDPDAAFLFAQPEAFPPDAVPFDAPGAELSHHGEDCTFETLVKRAGLADRRLRHLAEIVHDIDLRDAKFGREEARGLDLLIRGLLGMLKEDDALLEEGMTVFDALFAALDAR
jgi:hypothetical protein